MKATREEYNTCMRPYITGKGKTREQRKLDFCIGAKVCSGKAQTDEEAKVICDVPRIPKWAVALLPKEEEPITCTLRDTRVKEALDIIMLKVKEGEAEEARPLAAQTINDIFTCHTKDKTIQELTEEAMQEFNDLSKRHYIKGEAKGLQDKFSIIKEIL